METQEKTRYKNDRILGDSYKTPFTIAKEMSEEFKRERGEYRKLRAKLISDVHFEFPKASKERSEALAFHAQSNKKLHEIRERYYINSSDPELTLRPNLTKTLKSSKVRRYSHNGKWEMNPIEKAECWSCCMNGE